MDCKHINFVINKISIEKNLVKKILCEIIKYKINEKQKNHKILADIITEDISQKTQTIYIFLMLQLYTFKTLCDIPCNKFNDILYKKLNKISSNLNFFKKLFNFAIINVPLNHSEKKITFLMYTWFKKIICEICDFCSKSKLFENINPKKNDYSTSDSQCSNISYNSSDISLKQKKIKTKKNISRRHKCFLSENIMSNNLYSNKFMKNINYIILIINKFTNIANILNKNIDNKILEFQSNENNVLISNSDYELINKMIYVTFIHLQYLSKNINNIIKKIDIDVLNHSYMMDKINIYNSKKYHNEPSLLFCPVDINENKNIKNNDKFIKVIIGNEISRIQFISCNCDIEKAIEILSQNKDNMDNIIKLLNMNNQIATYFISIILNEEISICENE